MTKLHNRKSIFIRIIIVFLAMAVIGLRKLSSYCWIHNKTTISVIISVLTFLAMCVTWGLIAVQFKLGKPHAAEEKTENTPLSDDNGGIVCMKPSNMQRGQEDVSKTGDGFTP